MLSPRLARLIKRSAIGVVCLAVLLAAWMGGVYAWHWHTFPYGFSHCCLKQLGMALGSYAEEHDGHFPIGGGCPEASLSLLYRGDYDMDGQILCGKTKSCEVAQAILEGGELLGPDTCDWHYIEGLTLADDRRLVILWDKVGLGHNGQKLPRGGHSVLRLLGDEEVIPESEWPAFLEMQEQLMAARTEAAKKALPALTATIRLPSGEVVDHYNAAYTLDGGRGPERSRGPKLDASALRWYRPLDGTYTFVLSFNGWESKPVDVRVSEGKATPAFFVFEMQ